MEKTKKSIFKKWWFWVIVVVVLVAIFSGGSGDDADTDATEKKAVEATDTADGAAENDTTAEQTKEEATKSEENNATEAVTEATESSTATVEEQVLMEQEGIKVTLTELAYDDIFGPELKVLIENSSDQNVTIQVRNCSINGFMVEPMFSSDVAAGKSANDGITFMNSELEAAGIDVIQDIELNLHVIQTDTFESLFDSETIHIATSMAGKAEQAVDDSGVVVIDQDGIKVTVKGADSENSFWGMDIFVYVENTSDKNVTVQARDVSLNGFMVDPMFSCDVAAGKKAYDTITFLESDLEDNGITEIKDMELSFTVFETDTFDTIMDTEMKQVTFE